MRKLGVDLRIWFVDNGSKRQPVFVGQVLSPRQVRQERRQRSPAERVGHRAEAAALEGAEFGVRVNAVAPGPIETGMLNRFTATADRKASLIAGVPFKRAGKPEEIANAILYLTSDQASFVTGQILSVDGGKSAQ